MKAGEFRLLGPDEPSTGMHEIEGVDEHGTVVARFECLCQWCVAFRAAMQQWADALADVRPSRVPDWLRR